MAETDSSIISGRRVAAMGAGHHVRRQPRAVFLHQRDLAPGAGDGPKIKPQRGDAMPAQGNALGE